VVKVSRDGVTLAWARGVLGQLLPQSSPASEHVAPLAAVLLSQSVHTALSDYSGVVGLESAPVQTLCHRKSMYAGLRLEIRGRSGPNFAVRKVPAHVDPDSCSDPEERFLALGNQLADEHAKAAALSQPGPSSAELEEWREDTNFLRRFLLYVPRALALWPHVAPYSGKKSLPKREGFVARRGGSSFASDLLHPWLESASSSCQPPQEWAEPLNATATASHCIAPPPPPADGSRRPRSTREVEHHVWAWQVGRWVCTACLSTSRGAVPSRIYGCKGMAPNLADLFK
jgi:hypothetical protein